jgi:Uma2 family endonuclease
MVEYPQCRSHEMTSRQRTATIPPDVRELHNGDRMDAATFHRIYLDTPEDFRAELIGGIVYVASPVGHHHSEFHLDLGGLLWLYARQTPGVDCGNNATVRLGDSGEPQPDMFLRVDQECGGQSRIEDNYVVGAPELVAEITHSSLALDMGSKYDDYRRYGVQEYLVLDLHDRQLRWFDLKADQELKADADGVIRARQFPGLWLNSAAILGGDFPAMRAALEAGMASAQYKEFAKRLTAAKANPDR